VAVLAAGRSTLIPHYNWVRIPSDADQSSEVMSISNWPVPAS